MIKISAPDSPLPKICYLASVLSESAQTALDKENIPPIDVTVSRKFWRILETIGIISMHVKNVTQNYNHIDRDIIGNFDFLLRETEALMHQISELADFLASVVEILIPSKPGQKRLQVK